MSSCSVTDLGLCLMWSHTVLFVSESKFRLYSQRISRLFHCSVINVFAVLTSSLSILSCLIYVVKLFLKFFVFQICSIFRNSSVSLSQVFDLVNNFFRSFLTSFWIVCTIRIVSSAPCLAWLSLLFSAHLQKTKNGERGIWTLAPRERPTPLAGAPLQPLEYFSLVLN